VKRCRVKGLKGGKLKFFYRRYLGRTPMPPELIFLKHTLVSENGCWIWTSGNGNGNGYGRLKANGKCVLAHRFSYECAKGPIPKDFEVDHLCGIPACVNPAHLEAVTHRENNSRSSSPSAICAKRNHCSRGHKYRIGSFRVRRGKRECLKCVSILKARAYLKSVGRSRLMTKEEWVVCNQRGQTQRRIKERAMKLAAASGHSPSIRRRGLEVAS